MARAASEVADSISASRGFDLIRRRGNRGACGDGAVAVGDPRVTQKCWNDMEKTCWESDSWVGKDGF